MKAHESALETMTCLLKMVQVKNFMGAKTFPCKNREEYELREKMAFDEFDKKKIARDEDLPFPFICTLLNLLSSQQHDKATIREKIQKQK